MEKGQMIAAAQVMEDDNYVDVGLIEEQSMEFPSPSEEEDVSESDSDEEEKEESSTSRNNNANVDLVRNHGSTSAHRSPLPRTQNAGQQQQAVLPNFIEDSPGNTDSGSSNLIQSITMMQDFMLKKGIISAPLNQAEICNLMNSQTSNLIPEIKKDARPGCKGKTSAVKSKQTAKPDNLVKEANHPVSAICDHSPSEVTIYKRAVWQKWHPETNDLEGQIHQFISNVWDENKQAAQHKQSSSSGELMDTSDECDVALMAVNLIPDAVEAGTSSDNLNIAQMDKDYQMLNTHIKDAIKKKIQD